MVRPGSEVVLDHFQGVLSLLRELEREGWRTGWREEGEREGKQEEGKEKRGSERRSYYLAPVHIVNINYLHTLEIVCKLTKNGT